MSKSRVTARPRQAEMPVAGKPMAPANPGAAWRRSWPPDAAPSRTSQLNVAQRFADVGIVQSRTSRVPAVVALVQREPDGERRTGDDTGVRADGPAASCESTQESTPVLLYFTHGEQIFVAPKPACDDPLAISRAFGEAGADMSPSPDIVSEVVPSDPTWLLFYALYLDQQGRDGEIDWLALGRAAGDTSIIGDVGETPASQPNAPRPRQNAPATLPAPWNPPGSQPIPLYIGDKAHRAIAARYIATHPGQGVFTNFTPLGTILGRLALEGIPGLDPKALGGAEKLLRPDILNSKQRHLYEIKPEKSAALAQAEAQVYIAALARAGLVVTLGPTTEPGTHGVLPAPGGVFRFWSPVPGVIVYQYSKPRPQPVPVPQPQEQPDAKPQPFIDVDRIWEWKYWEEVTGLTGAALVLYLIISEGSRVIPARNAVPIL